jgi:excisionase family DNA binding protein
VPEERAPLFVRLPRGQIEALDRVARASGRPKQAVVSDLLAARLPVGRADIRAAADFTPDVLTLDEVATLLRVPSDAVERRVAGGDMPGRRLGDDWRFSREAVLDWLSGSERRRRAAGAGF